MNPNLIWDELRAEMADNRQLAEHRHLEGEVHRACWVCGAENPEHGIACTTCGVKLRPAKAHLFAVKAHLFGFGREV